MAGTWVPRGSFQGPEGKSAYKLAVEAGFTGTESEWRASLKGGKGDTGKTAYQYAVEAGYAGTEAEFKAAQEAVPAAAQTAESAAQSAAASAGLVGAPAGEAVRAAIGPGGAAEASLKATIVGEVTPVRASVTAADPVSYDPTRARALKSALARVKLGTGRLDVLMIGDSWLEGGGATVKGNRMLTRVQDLLRAQFQPAGVKGGIGYWPSVQSQALPWANGWIQTGPNVVADHTGLGRRARSLPAGSSMGIKANATSFRIVYEQSPNRGSFKYTVDGGPETTVSATNADQLGGRTVTVGPLISGEHTILITAIGQTVLEGIEVLDGDETTGVHVWEAAQYGWSTARMMANPGWLTAIPNLVSPDVVLSTFGINDYQFTGWIVTPEQFEIDYRKLVDGVRGKATKPLSWFIFIPSEPKPAATNTAPWSAYRAVLVKLADEYGFGLIDGGTALGDVKTAGAYGIGNGDGYHLSNVGHEVAAHTIHAALTAKADYTA